MNVEINKEEVANTIIKMHLQRGLNDIKEGKVNASIVLLVKRQLMAEILPKVQDAHKLKISNFIERAIKGSLMIIAKK